MAVTLLAKIANLTTVGKSIFNTNVTKIGEIAVDCSHLEVIEWSNNITDHPVESGSYVSDHIYNKPTKIKLHCSVVDAASSIIGVVQNAANLFNGNILDNVKSVFSSKGRNQVTTYEVIKDLATNKGIVDIVSYWDSFPNMAVESVSLPRDGKTGERLYFEITLKQVTFADVQFSNISSNPRSVQDILSSKVKLGKKQTLPPTVEQKRSASALSSLTGGIKSLVGF